MLIKSSPLTPRRSPPRVDSTSRDTSGLKTCIGFILRFSQTILFLLILTYTIMVLLPLIRYAHVLLLSNGSAVTSTIDSSADSRALAWFVSPQNQKNSNLQPNKDRIITLIHIGKAGGVSLRRLTVIYCKLFFRRQKWDTTREKRIAKCIDKYFPDPDLHPMTHQTQHYFHIEEYNATTMEQSTSFLVPLRNPVERIISTYRYSHPGNCNDENRNEVWRPRGCEVEKHRNKTGLTQNFIHFTCFPSPAMEDFAQALMKPWTKTRAWKNLSLSERRQCRYLAREMVQGYGSFGSAPHMLYNYAYYAQRSIWKYPDKEVFALRTEHREDMVALDKLLGGNGEFEQDREVSHGSEGYVPSPLSTEAYQKLCCVLETEIEVYQDILERARNLDATAKQESLDSLREKCGITTSWTEWRVECRSQLRNDLRILHPTLIVNETIYPYFKYGLKHPRTKTMFSKRARESNEPEIVSTRN